MNEISLLLCERPDIDRPKRPVRVVGIDLGTTNSTIAEVVWEPDSSLPLRARCLEVEQPTFEGVYTNILVPSFVAIDGDRVIVGEGAKRLRSNPQIFVQNKNLFYECKNDIGIKKTYHLAPEGFKSASEIGGRLLEFLHKAAITESETEIDRIVVTVPASFQASQRLDTLNAAELAGLELSGGDLLDEPVAAFLDYLVSHSDSFKLEVGKPKNLVIFDFGGGTCDIAIFRIENAKQGGAIKISPLAVSRYHRLGGGDIDRAILYEVVIPQLIEQNNLEKFDLSFEDKKKFIEPKLLAIAESLKIALCLEIARRKRFNKYSDENKSTICSRQPGVISFEFKNRKLTLKNPVLTADVFEKLLEPFLDRDLLYARETEYRLTCSIFAPLQDALERSELSEDDIDYCLMVGGSSLIPQVVEAVDEFFTEGTLLTYADKDSVQTAVARGAAYHALSLALFGKSIIQPICHDDINILSESGPVELISKGTLLPFPSDGSYASSNILAIPKSASLFDSIELKVEIVAGEDKSTLGSWTWKIGGPVDKGEPLCLEYRYDENQILDLRLKLASDDSESFSRTIENPLTNVVNPQTLRLKIEETEEELRTGEIPKQNMPDKLAELATDYAELGHREKALDLLKKALAGKPRPDANILNKMGIYAGEMGNYSKEERYYKEAAAITKWSGPLFNLALSFRKQNRLDEAIGILEQAMAKDLKAPQLVLRAMIAESLGNRSERDDFLKRAFETFDPISVLDEWQLGWYLTAARMAGEKERIDNIIAEQRKRRLSVDEGKEEGLLPMLTPGLRRNEV